MSELLPCPFCGRTFVEKYYNGGRHMVLCRNCSQEWSFDDWNTRPIESALQARIDALIIPADVRENTIDALEFKLAQLMGLPDVENWKSNIQRALDYFQGGK
jgi:hypothetical protein